MARTVCRTSATGYYLEDVRLEDDVDTPADCVATQPPSGLQWPRFVAGVWTDAGLPYTGERDPETGALLLPPDPAEG